MKRTLVMALLAFMAVAQMNAQTEKQNPKQAIKEHNSAIKAISKEKASKDAKKAEKQYRKQGWMTMASDKPMDVQISEDYVRASEVIKDADGNTVTRWIIHPAMATQGSYNAAIAQARLACQTEIAAQLETRIAGALEQKMSGTQAGADKAETLDKFHQRFKAIVDGCLTNMKRGLCIHRRTPNGNYEVQVTYAYDKKELAARLARQAQRELEMEGDQDLNAIVNDVIDNWE